MSANSTSGPTTLPPVLIATDRIPYGTQLFWIYVGIYVALALCAGLFAGLTIGILSLDPLTLKVVSESGATEKQRRRAKRLLPIVKRHHLVLVSLVLANAAAVEAMPVFLNGITNELVAIGVSVTVVLFMGEIVPQAVCTKYGLAIGSCMLPLIYFTIFISFPLTYPIAKLLDCVLGKDHHTFYRRQELKALVAMHGPPREKKKVRIANGQAPNGIHSPSMGSRTNLINESFDGGDGTDRRSPGGDGAFFEHGGDHEVPLSRDEVMVIEGVLNLREKTVAAAMISFDQVFVLSMDAVLDFRTFDKILKEGYSRIPVYEGSPQNIEKILLVKTLITVNPDDRITVRNLLMRAEFHAVNAAFVNVDRSLSDVLNDFKAARAGHLSMVCREKPATGDGGATKEVVGIVTLEDVIEEMLQVEIYDEFDNIPRMPSIPGYLHYRKVHRVHSHWDSNDAGSLMDSMEASHPPMTRPSRYRRHRPKFRRQSSAGHVDDMMAQSPDSFRKKYVSEANAISQEEHGRITHTKRNHLKPPEFYLTDPESSGSEVAPGSVNSIGSREIEAIAFPAGPFVVTRGRPIVVDSPSSASSSAHSTPSAASPRAREMSEEGYFQPVMEVLSETGDSNDTRVSMDSDEGAESRPSVVTHTVQLHRTQTPDQKSRNQNGDACGGKETCSEQTPLLKKD